MQHYHTCNEQSVQCAVIALLPSPILLPWHFLTCTCQGPRRNLATLASWVVCKHCFMVRHVGRGCCNAPSLQGPPARTPFCCPPLRPRRGPSVLVHELSTRPTAHSTADRVRITLRSGERCLQLLTRRDDCASRRPLPRNGRAHRVSAPAHPLRLAAQCCQNGGLIPASSLTQ
jgi:hypothetical protein